MRFANALFKTKLKKRKANRAQSKKNAFKAMEYYAYFFLKIFLSLKMPKFQNGLCEFFAKDSQNNRAAFTFFKASLARAVGVYPAFLLAKILLLHFLFLGFALYNNF